MHSAFRVSVAVSLPSLEGIPLCRWIERFMEPLLLAVFVLQLQEACSKEGERQYTPVFLDELYHLRCLHQTNLNIKLLSQLIS